MLVTYSAIASAQPFMNAYAGQGPVIAPMGGLSMADLADTVDGRIPVRKGI